MAVVNRLPHNGEYCGNMRLERSISGRRRVFVQTETGFVLPIELDRSDNAHTVKKKLQVALNVPTEERSLVFGDMVLKNDLSTVRNDSPLLLAKNFMHRSSSTPCLSPTMKDIQQSDADCPVEVLGFSDPFARVQDLVNEIVKAIKIGVEPIPVHSGLGGAYYFKSCNGENAAIVKPTDEEPYAPNNPKGFVGKALGQPGLKRSVRVGETGFREVAAYLLDFDHFAKVPSTVLVKVTHPIFNVNDGVKGNKHKPPNQVSKIASLQQFIPHDFDASDHGTSSYPVNAVHRIGILDIRILNTDRHAGNLLVRKLDRIGRFGQVELVPIDHGLCLPESLEDPYFEWIHWPQASVPFSQDELEYIHHLDPFEDADMLRRELPMIREACLRVLVVCTVFLKEAAAFGLCLAEIGEMMSREFRGHEEELSELELICIRAWSLIGETETVEVKGEHEDFEFDSDNELLDWTLDIEDRQETMSPSPRCEGGNCQTPLFRVEEVEDGEKNEVTYLDACAHEFTMHTISKVSMLSQSISAGEKIWRRHDSTLRKNGHLAGTSSGNMSVSEHLHTSTSFAKLADLTEKEWIWFIENFRKLLPPAFANHKSGNFSQRHRQKFGASCLF